MKSLSKLSWWLTLVLVVGTPLHGFVSTFLLYKLGLAEVAGLGLLLQGWKELIILILCLISLLFAVKKKWWPNELQVAIVAYVIIGLVVSITNWSNLSLAHLVWGARAEFSFLIFLFSLVWLLKIWSETEKVKLIRWLLGTGLFVILIGLVLHFVGYEVLAKFGYRNEWSTIVLNDGPAYCQKEAHTSLCRAQSTFFGPNRYGGYLLMLLPVIWYGLKVNWQRWLAIIALITSVFFTISSSALVGLLVLLMVSVGIKMSTVIRRYWKVVAVVATIIFTVVTISVSENWDNIYERINEDPHVTGPMQALEMFSEKPFGYGLGIAGPASFRTGEKFLPENWPVATLVNTGVFGLTLFISIFILLVWLLLERWRDPWAKVAFVSLVALAAQNLFVHSLEDPGVYIGLMLLVALGIDD